MGRCKICKKSTKYNYPFCWQHYYFNFGELRFVIAFLLTVFVEYVINNPIIDENGLMLLTIKALSDLTQFPSFGLLYIIGQVAAFIGCLMYMNYLIYKLFYSERRTRIRNSAYGVSRIR